MKALITILAASFAFANGAIAADVAVASASAATPAATAAAVQSVTISKTRSRSEVRAEAIEALKQHKTTLAIQLAQYQ